MSNLDVSKPAETDPAPVEVVEGSEGTASAGRGPARPAQSAFSKWKGLIIVGALGATVAILLLGSGAQEAFVYSKLVDEVVTHPAEWRGRELRVEGLLTQGSIRFRESPCEWRFRLEKNGQNMAVRYPQCIVPDTFRDGVNLTVVVQGKLQPDGSFLASQVVPRCPSKYEMQKAGRNGVARPYNMEGVSPTSPPRGAAPAAVRGTAP
jgi:cytochrome c-type biogenesis protein CcmE